MIIEFVGTPGSGKSTLLPTVINFFQEQGICAFTVVDAARPCAKRTIIGQIVYRFAPISFRSALLWQVFYGLSTIYRAKFIASHPRFIWHVFRSQWRRPTEANASRRKVSFWFIRLIGYYAFLLQCLNPNTSLVLDEGFLHRVVQFFSSSVEEPNQTQIANYINLLPKPDLVIFIQASLETCEKRLYSRGIRKPFQDKKPSEISKFLSHAHLAVNLAVNEVKQKGWNIIEVDNESGEIATAKADLRKKLAINPNIQSNCLKLQKA